ncbi:MAG: hypothetical protein AB7F22_14735 [Reyranella sp.]|uniref:hypothetical protein n=1 Tax=Reyranella sp. TaxID=1929291 RepID=UPI003D0F4BE1
MMKRPDPRKLSPEQKDALIRDLQRQVATGQSELRLLRRRLGLTQQQSQAAASDRAPFDRSRSDRSPSDRGPSDHAPSGRDLFDKLAAAAPRPSTAPPTGIAVKLGRHLGLWRSPMVMGVVGVVLAAFAIDGGIGIWQDQALRRYKQARLLLEHQALTSLYVELKRIVPEPDGKSYRMTIAMQNIDAAAPLYVMLNAVGVYVQSGLIWQQVPSSPADGAGRGVVKLVDGYTYDIVFTPEVANWAELIPGYMHVRIQSDMLISRQAQPGNDIVERRTPFYVYLKPHGANDADIKARSKMSGTPPVFIPMPPH